MRSAGLALFVFSIAALGASAEDYVLGPDSLPQPGVPRGEVTQYKWTSAIFPGTERDYWVYVPKQYDPAHPACGGGRYLEWTTDLAAQAGAGGGVRVEGFRGLVTLDGIAWLITITDPWTDDTGDDLGAIGAGSPAAGGEVR